MPSFSVAKEGPILIKRLGHARSLSSLAAWEKISHMHINLLEQCVHDLFPLRGRKLTLDIASAMTLVAKYLALSIIIGRTGWGTVALFLIRLIAGWLRQTSLIRIRVLLHTQTAASMGINLWPVVGIGWITVPVLVRLAMIGPRVGRILLGSNQTSCEQAYQYKDVDVYFTTHTSSQCIG
jgi:hypothetical protein